jgi:FtsH-binding integral membrane protein
MTSVPTRVSSAGDASAERVTAFLRVVYAWMFVGLGITAAVAAAIMSTPAFE